MATELETSPSAHTTVSGFFAPMEEDETPKESIEPDEKSLSPTRAEDGADPEPGDRTEEVDRDQEKERDQDRGGNTDGERDRDGEGDRDGDGVEGEGPGIGVPDVDSVGSVGNAEQAENKDTGDSINIDDDDLDNLSPPPDSPSPVSSPRQSPSVPPANEAFDEIVVGTKSNGVKKAPRVISDQGDAEPDAEADVEMEDAVEEQPVVSHSHYPKRKRNSLYSNLNEDKNDGLLGDTPKRSPASATPLHSKPRTHGLANVRGITLGYWRDSNVPDEKDKHAVIGFIDVRDRLRTRVQQHSRSNKLVADKYPLPPGPGGSWVTFERVVFDPHLVNLDHHVVKEYVKVRVETAGTEKTEAEVKANNLAAVKEAIQRVTANPPPDTAVVPAIAYGVDIPEHALRGGDTKKRRLNTGAGLATGGNPTASPSGDGSNGTGTGPGTGTSTGAGTGANGSSLGYGAALDTLPGTRPTKILVGYWRGSSEEDPRDKHAVMGILGANDMFRVKVTRETRDGRPMNGNFPQGAGALWIPYEDVCFEPQLRDLSRPEIKEYCRVRQWQIDHGETSEDKAANEVKALQDARIRAGRSPHHILMTESLASTDAGTNPGGAPAIESNSLSAQSPRLQAKMQATKEMARAQYERQTSPNDEQPRPTAGSSKRSYAGHELRGARSRDPDGREIASRPPRHSLPNASHLRAANRPQPQQPAQSRSANTTPTNNGGGSAGHDRLERAGSYASRSVARAEAAQSRFEQRNANRESSSAAAAAPHSQHGHGHGHQRPSSSDSHGQPPRENSKVQFSENMSRLNKVWESQEVHRLKPASSSSGGGSGGKSTDNAKMYGGIKYERKQSGPFQGKLVSQGTIISINGEDYVEYRVLTKPSFF